jgi:RimJ/RimL family protein N-acetyltransferase
MRHNFSAEGFGMRLRPVVLEDAAFIVWLRNLQHAKGRISDTSNDVAAQEKWLRSYFERPLDYYFIIETQRGIPVGTYGFYDFDQDNTAETGRWIIRLGVPAALPTVVLVLELAFQTLALSAVRARTVSTNHPVLSIHRKLGFRQTGVQQGVQTINGKEVDLVLSVLSAADGLQARERLLGPARWAERRIREWEAQHAGTFGEPQAARTDPVPLGFPPANSAA